MPLKLISSGGGSIILDAPSTGSNFTLTVPAENGSVITTAAATGVNASAISTGTVPRARIAAGTVIQSVSASSNGATSSGSGVWFDGPCSVTITPYFATSQILLLSVFDNNYNASGPDTYFRIMRNGGVVGTYYSTQGYDNTLNAAAHRFQFAKQFLDSPSSTSALTYKYQGYTGAGTLYLNYPTDRGTHWMTALEIAQ